MVSRLRRSMTALMVGQLGVSRTTLVGRLKTLVMLAMDLWTRPCRLRTRRCQLSGIIFLLVAQAEQIGRTVGGLVAEVDGSVEQPADREPEQSPPSEESWFIRGDASHLHEEKWGKVHREHVLKSHIPFSSSCEFCVRSRGLEPARSIRREDGGAGASKEVQVDKLCYKACGCLYLCWSVASQLGVACIAVQRCREAATR